MSAPGLGGNRNISLTDHAWISELPKPLRALVYLILLTVGTVVGLVALALAIVVVGGLTGSFDLAGLLGG